LVFALCVGDGDYFVFTMQVHESLNGNIWSGAC
jgi:hypothetical protein